MEKFAYPNIYADIFAKPVRNLEKWKEASDKIVALISNGNTFRQSFLEVTANWDQLEAFDYESWLRYYKDGAHLKYPKTATAQQLVFSPGFHLPKESFKKEEKIDDKDLKRNKKETIEQHRSRIIARLQAAEKLLASIDGQEFAGDYQEDMLRMLQDLKRKVQTANKISINSTLFEDLIIKEANILNSNGLVKQAVFIYKLAEDPNMPLPDGAALPDPNMPLPDGSVPLPAEAAPPAKSNGVQALDAFERLLDGKTPDDLDVSDIEDEEEEDAIVVTAQDAGFPPEPAPVPAAPPAPLPVPMPEQAPPAPAQAPPEATPEPAKLSQVPNDNTDDVIEEALDNITMHDAIRRLEMLVGIYKKREISRQLSILDIMLNRLGIGSFFPGLGEAQGKALESNQYISTRLEDMLGKLKGSLTNDKAEEVVLEVRDNQDPEALAVRKTLEEQKAEQQAAKDARRKKEQERLSQTDQPVQPALPVAPEMQQPVPVEVSQPVVQ